MQNRSRFRRVLGLLAGFSLLSILGAPAVGQETKLAPGSCTNTYTLDKVKNRITFQGTKLFVVLPEKDELGTLRAQGTPGQLFRMKDCLPDLEADIPVYEQASNGAGASETISSFTVRVIILAEKDNWVQVKGHTSLWKGTGWVRLDAKTVLIKY